MTANCTNLLRWTYILVMVLNVQCSSISSSESFIRAMWADEVLLAGMSSFVTKKFYKVRQESKLKEFL